MARPPAPPGPPPAHYRPPGTPPPPASGPLGPLAGQPAPSARAGGIGPGAATAVATVMLVVGLIAGFFIGRAYDDGDSTVLGPIVTTPPSNAPEPDDPPTGDTIPQEPPSPSAPPSTDLPPESLGTIDAPIPAGQAYVLGLYEIEVRGVDRDATAALAAHEPSNPPPPAGQRHVLVELAVRFTDASGLGNPAAIPFFLSDGAGVWPAFDAACGTIPEPLAESGLLEQGDEAVGNLCFTVPEDAVDAVALGTESFSGPLYFALP